MKAEVIRKPEPNELPLILDLARRSLGDQHILRTEAYWNWKHNLNPFGKSPVLISEETDKLTGVRAMMQWQFQHVGQILSAYRAVDTATDPDFRGRGIFSRLTMQLVTELQQGSPALIFNTPNKRSRPGYLKMGWQNSGKTNLYICVSPVNLAGNHLFKRNIPGVVPQSFQLPDEPEKLLKNFSELLGDQLFTAYSQEFLIWRYSAIPGIRYFSFNKESSEGRCSIIWRTKTNYGLRELRLLEIFFEGSPGVVRTAIREVAAQTRPDVVTVLTDGDGVINECLPFGFFAASSAGLNITARLLNDSSLFSEFMQQDKRYLSAGTVELF